MHSLPSKLLQTAYDLYPYSPFLSKENHPQAVWIAQTCLFPLRRTWGGTLYSITYIGPSSVIYTPISMEALPRWFQVVASIVAIPLFIFGAILMMTVSGENFRLFKIRFFLADLLSKAPQQREALLKAKWSLLFEQDRKRLLTLIIARWLTGREDTHQLRPLLTQMASLTEDLEEFYSDFIRQIEQSIEISQDFSLDHFYQLLEAVRPFQGAPIPHEVKASFIRQKKYENTKEFLSQFSAESPRRCAYTYLIAFIFNELQIFDRIHEIKNYSLFFETLPYSPQAQAMYIPQATSNIQKLFFNNSLSTQKFPLLFFALSETQQIEIIHSLAFMNLIYLLQSLRDLSLEESEKILNKEYLIHVAENTLDRFLQRRDLYPKMLQALDSSLFLPYIDLRFVLRNLSFLNAVIATPKISNLFQHLCLQISAPVWEDFWLLLSKKKKKPLFSFKYDLSEKIALKILGCFFLELNEAMNSEPDSPDDHFLHYLTPILLQFFQKYPSQILSVLEAIAWYESDAIFIFSFKAFTKFLTKKKIPPFSTVSKPCDPSSLKLLEDIIKDASPHLFNKMYRLLSFTPHKAEQFLSIRKQKNSFFDVETLSPIPSLFVLCVKKISFLPLFDSIKKTPEDLKYKIPPPLLGYPSHL